MGPVQSHIVFQKVSTSRTNLSRCSLVFRITSWNSMAFRRVFPLHLSCVHYCARQYTATLAGHLLLSKHTWSHIFSTYPFLQFDCASLTIFVQSPWSRLCCIRLFKLMSLLHYITASLTAALTIDRLLLRRCAKVDGTLSVDGSRVRVEDGNLTMEKIRREDHGKYECVATNIVTRVVTATQLIVERAYHSQGWNKLWKKLGRQKFLQLPPLFQFVPYLLGHTPFLPSSWGHACCDHNDSESYTPTNYYL